jgi:hypothetical protein
MGMPGASSTLDIFALTSSCFDIASHGKDGKETFESGQTP